MEKEIIIFYTKQAKKFLDKNKNILDKIKIKNLIEKFIKKYFFNKDKNIDFKKLQNFGKKGEDFFRIRYGNLRVIFSVKNGEIFLVDIQLIDFRGGVYKK